jgi:uncharacterized protein (TIGR03118 family)
MSACASRLALTVLAVSTLGVMGHGQHYTQINLVSSVSGAAPVTDASLVNPWGISRSSSSPWWVSDNAAGLSTLYQGNGTKVALTVAIPTVVPGGMGLPTGTIFNGSTTDFLISAGVPARFLFCTLDGLIVGWNNPTAGAVAVVTTTDGSSFTGVTSAVVNGQRRLYAANFTKGRVDVFDNAFHKISRDDDAFKDDDLPDRYVPFNVATIGNDIVVAYALHEPGQVHETDGAGLGYVAVFSSEGRLLHQLEHGDWLNAPWGVALAPHDFGAYSHALLVGQWGGGSTADNGGTIAAYDLATGRYLGGLLDPTGAPLAINGVWGIGAGNASPSDYDTAGSPGGELYFAAGPNHGTGGLFGYVKPVATELIEGNDQ